MGAEVSTALKRSRHPYDWCVDESWVAWQLFEALGGFRAELDAGEIIWDPSAGSGRTMVTFAEAGHLVLLSDIVNRVDPAEFDGAPPAFQSADFMETTKAPGPCSIVHNPPYSYCEGSGEYAGMLIAEAFVRHALKLATRRVCAVLPLKWMASQGRFRLFAQDHPPQAVLVLTQRPSMPPGDMLPALIRAGRAFKGGVVDYAWFVWNVQQPTPPNHTRTIWLPPLDQPVRPIEELI